MAIVPVAGVTPRSEIWLSYTGTHSHLYLTQPSSAASIAALPQASIQAQQGVGVSSGQTGGGA